MWRNSKKRIIFVQEINNHLKITVMRNFEVIYNTATMKGVHYAFGAESMEAAIEKAPKLITAKIVKVVEVNDLGELIEPVTVTTALAVGGEKDFKFGNHSIKMYDNKEFSKSYRSHRDFLEDFPPTKPTNNLLSRISQEFSIGGKITFKPEGYKANMTFYFSYPLRKEDFGYDKFILAGKDIHKSYPDAAIYDDYEVYFIDGSGKKIVAKTKDLYTYLPVFRMKNPNQQQLQESKEWILNNQISEEDEN